MTEELLVGAEAPDFTLENDAGGTTTLSALRGKGVILYFYPKDNTAGCTTQAIAFRDNLARFEALGFTVIGVSRDSVNSHCGFRERQGLNFTLLSDKAETVCNLYGVLKEKMMYGRRCFGIERSTFVISPEGKLLYVMRGVKAKTHVAELLALLEGAA